VEDLYSAEQQLVAALPAVAAAATSPELKQALEQHLEQTRTHVTRLEGIMGDLGVAAGGKECKGMQGLIAEGREVMQMTGDPTARDAALIAAAQRIEHYEIASYGTAKALAGELGLDEWKGVLDETLDEEATADKLLTKIATGGMFRAGVNERAAS